MGVESSVSSLSRVNGTRPTSSVLRIRDLASFSLPFRDLRLSWNLKIRIKKLSCDLSSSFEVIIIFFFLASFKQGIKTDGEFILEASIK